jgi:p21-activated kinase 1
MNDISEKEMMDKPETIHDVVSFYNEASGPPPTKYILEKSQKGQPPHPPAPAHPSPRPRARQNRTIDTVAQLKHTSSVGEPRDIYRGFNKIAQGASGGVFTAYEKGTNQLVLIKQVNLDQQPKKDLLVREVLMMKENPHPNLLSFVASYLCDRVDLWVVLGFVEGSNLCDVIAFSILTEGQIASVCRETLKGLQHLHSIDIIHRDVTSENILVSVEGKIKISQCNPPRVRHVSNYAISNGYFLSKLRVFLRRKEDPEKHLAGGAVLDGA